MSKGYDCDHNSKSHVSLCLIGNVHRTGNMSKQKHDEDNRKATLLFFVSECVRCCLSKSTRTCRVSSCTITRAFDVDWLRDNLSISVLCHRIDHIRRRIETKTRRKSIRRKQMSSQLDSIVPFGSSYQLWQKIFVACLFHRSLWATFENALSPTYASCLTRNFLSIIFDTFATPTDHRLWVRSSFAVRFPSVCIFIEAVCFRLISSRSSIARDLIDASLPRYERHVVLGRYRMTSKQHLVVNTFVSIERVESSWSKDEKLKSTLARWITSTTRVLVYEANRHGQHQSCARVIRSFDECAAMMIVILESNVCLST
jgi:hypothetical protein